MTYEVKTSISIASIWITRRFSATAFEVWKWTFSLWNGGKNRLISRRYPRMYLGTGSRKSVPLINLRSGVLVWSRFPLLQGTLLLLLSVKASIEIPYGTVLYPAGLAGKATH
jgi:hypothetical protein